MIVVVHTVPNVLLIIPYIVMIVLVPTIKLFFPRACTTSNIFCLDRLYDVLIFVGTTGISQLPSHEPKLSP